MKTKVVALMLLAVTFVSSVIAQFEGKIVYELDYELPEAMEAQRAMLPPSMDMIIGKDNVKIIQKTMMGEQVVITDTKKDETILLMDMAGQKTAIKIPAEEKEKQDKSPKPEFKYDSKTKKVAGYKCKHAVMVMKGDDGEEIETDVYYTEEIPAQANTKLKGLKGFPLEYSVTNRGMVITMTAKNIEKIKVAKSEFDVPEGYKVMTMEEFQEMMTGGK